VKEGKINVFRTNCTKPIYRVRKGGAYSTSNAYPRCPRCGKLLYEIEESADADSSSYQKDFALIRTAHYGDVKRARVSNRSLQDDTNLDSHMGFRTVRRNRGNIETDVHTVRGGSYTSFSVYCRSALRNRYENCGCIHMGFRTVRTAKPVNACR
jgi:formylglycine-generating enzyme required for sulfatase activity